MKKLLSLFFLCMVCAGNLFSQVAAYSFNQLSAAYAPITGGTVVVVSGGAPASDDVVYPAQNIGFTFNYNGTNYTTFGVSSNGFIWFGSGSATTTVYTPISSATVGTPTIDGIISALGRNILKRTTTPFGELRIETIGIAPNRMCIIQFTNWRGFGIGTGAQYNFQIGLEETTNSIYFNYGSFVMTGATTATDFQIGLRGSSNADFKTVVATNASWTAATLGIANNSSSTLSTTIFPVSGTVFQFVPPMPCIGTPTAGSATSSVANACSGVNFNLNLSGSTTGVSGLSYQWQSSIDGVTYTNIGGATNMMYSTSITDTTYFQCIVTCTTSGQDDTSLSVQVNIAPFYTCYCASNATNTADTKIDSVNINGVSTFTSPTLCETYTNYTSVTGINLQIASGNPVYVKNGSCSGNHYAAILGVYLDLNFDGDFNDLGEMMYTSSPSTGLNTLAPIIITPPMGTLSGMTGMRFIFSEDATVEPPCGTYTYGETEDYLVNLLPAVPCSNPPVGGTINGPAMDTIGNTVMYTLSGHNGDVIQWYISSDGVNFTIISGANNDTLYHNLNSMNTVYFNVVMSSSGCTNDTSNIIMTTVYHNNDVCNAFPLVIGVNGPYSNVGATVQPGEVFPPGTGCEMQNGWCNNILNNTIWFTFVAPPSGRVSIQAPAFDAQLAVWQAQSCTDLLNATLAQLIAANDDDSAYATHGGTIYSPFIEGQYCLNPGATYYLQLDGYNGATVGSTNIILTDIGPSPTPVVSLADTVMCDSLELDAGNPGSTYLWSTGDVTQATTVNTSGTYNVSVTDQFGCSATDTVTVTSISPSAGFTATQTAVGQFDFASTSTPSGGMYGTTYNWDFGDATTGSNEMETHNYLNNGTFNAMLIVTNACGSDTSIQSVLVNGVFVNGNPGPYVTMIYPNPVNEVIYIQSDTPIEYVQLVSANGAVVYTAGNLNSNRGTINVSTLQTGPYFLYMKNANGRHSTLVSIIR